MLKKDGSLWIYINYHQLNMLTIKNKYHLPRIDDNFVHLKGAIFFCKINLSSGFHLLKICEVDITKTTFQTQYCHYEFLIMSLGVNSAPVAFIDPMNWVFRKFLDCFMIVFIDDILVYSEREEDHANLL